MARSNRRLSEVEQVRPYLEGVAKNLVERLYGPNGPAWGTRMSELEDVVVAVRKALSEKMLAEALERQAAVAVSERPEEYQSCPSCGQPMAAEKAKSRKVQTLGGTAKWSERKSHCPDCRRSFFPSVEESGD